jgi:putative nucleotidyltransferase with HDIG domain
VDFKKIIQVIQFDQAITANCLKLCNSSYFGLRVKVFSLDQAVVMLGLKNIVMIVLANCSGLSLYSGAHEGYGLNPGELWRHSITCAIISQLLVRKANMHDDAPLFTASLLHDVGKLVMDRFLVDHFDDFTEAMQEGGMSVVEAETAVFGINHAQLGGYIAESWNFPDALINSIRNHHEGLSQNGIPNMESWVRLSNLVYYVSLVHMFCSQYPVLNCRIEDSHLKRFGLKQQDITGIISALPVELKKAESLLKIAF